MTRQPIIRWEVARYRAAPLTLAARSRQVWTGLLTCDPRSTGWLRVPGVQADSSAVSLLRPLGALLTWCYAPSPTVDIGQRRSPTTPWRRPDALETPGEAWRCGPEQVIRV